MTIVDSSKGIVVRARAKNDVPSLRSSTVAGQNDGNLFQRWEIVTPFILPWHDTKTNSGIGVVGKLLKKFMSVLEIRSVFVRTKEHGLKSIHCRPRKIIVSVHALSQHELSIVNVELCVGRGNAVVRSQGPDEMA